MGATEWAMIIIAVLGLIGTLIGSFLANRKGSIETKAEIIRIESILSLQLQQLEEKVDVHNSLIDRMYNVESSLLNICYRVGELEKNKEEEV